MRSYLCNNLYGSFLKGALKVSDNDEGFDTGRRTFTIEHTNFIITIRKLQLLKLEYRKDEKNEERNTLKQYNYVRRKFPKKLIYFIKNIL